MEIDFNKDPAGHCIEAFASSDSDHRFNAADILRGLAGDAEPALSVLCHHLENDPDIEVQRQCAFALSEIGYVLRERAESVLPFLYRVLNGNDDELVESAESAIKNITR